MKSNTKNRITDRRICMFSGSVVAQEFEKCMISNHWIAESVDVAISDLGVAIGKVGVVKSGAVVGGNKIKGLDT